MVNTQENYCLLGIDYGIMRTGLAIGNSLTQTSRPLTTIVTNDDQDKVKQIKQIVVNWDVQQIILGKPSLNKNSPTNILLINKIDKFAHNLAQSLALTVTMINEDFSSYEAADLLKQKNITNYKKQKQKLDSMAACVILQQYFHEQQSLNL